MKKKVLLTVYCMLMLGWISSVSLGAPEHVIVAYDGNKVAILDGSILTTLRIATGIGQVTKIAVQANGNIVTLTADGRLSIWNPDMTTESAYSTGWTGAQMALQSDGDVVLMEANGALSIRSGSTLGELAYSPGWAAAGPMLVQPNDNVFVMDGAGALNIRLGSNLGYVAYGAGWGGSTIRLIQSNGNVVLDSGSGYLCIRDGSTLGNVVEANGWYPRAMTLQPDDNVVLLDGGGGLNIRNGSTLGNMAWSGGWGTTIRFLSTQSSGDVVFIDGGGTLNIRRGTDLGWKAESSGWTGATLLAIQPSTSNVVLTGGGGIFMRSGVDLHEVSYVYPGFNDVTALAFQPTGGITVRGSLGLLDWLNNDISPIVVSATIEIRNPGDPTPLETHVVNLNQWAQYSFITQLTGIYELSVKGSHWLRKIQPDITLTAPEVIVEFPDLVNGDCNGDNQITSADLSRVLAAMDTVSTDTGFDSTADLDGDLEITSTDLSITLANMGQTGDL